MSTNKLKKIIFSSQVLAYCVLLLVCVVLQPTIIDRMTFDELHGGAECDCIESAQQNCFDYFSRRIPSDGNSMHKRNFRLQKRNRDAVFYNCKTWCSIRALSIDLWNDESKDFLCNLHAEKTDNNISLGIAPQVRNRLLVFKIKQYGGLVKSTPSRRNKYHHDFYYPDNFEPSERIELIKIVNLGSVLI